jgi:hypothetical protein
VCNLMIGSQASGANENPSGFTINTYCRWLHIRQPGSPSMSLRVANLISKLDFFTAYITLFGQVSPLYDQYCIT